MMYSSRRRDGRAAKSRNYISGVVAGAHDRSWHKPTLTRYRGCPVSKGKGDMPTAGAHFRI
jgi:hypothetical protein